MVQHGKTTSIYIGDGESLSIYLQRELDYKVEQAVSKYPGLFTSKSHFINCAITRELRRLEAFKPEIEIE